MPLTLETLRVADLERSKAARGVGRKTVITQDPMPVVGPPLVLNPSKESKSMAYVKVLSRFCPKVRRLLRSAR